MSFLDLCVHWPCHVIRREGIISELHAMLTQLLTSEVVKAMHGQEWKLSGSYGIIVPAGLNVRTCTIRA